MIKKPARSGGAKKTIGINLPKAMAEELRGRASSIVSHGSQ